MHPPKPHISPALAHLRHGVTATALLVALCAALQMLVFGFVHFTEVRWVEPRIDVQTVPLKVVTGAPVPSHIAGARGATPSITPVAAVAPEPTRELGNADAFLNTLSDLSVTGGVLCAALLAAFTVMGVMIAAGGAVPGVDRATSAAMWGAALLAVCLPWHSLLSTVPYAGVFGPYPTMTSMSLAAETGSGSSLSLLVQFLLMPLAAMGCAFLVIYRFRAGIAEGIIATSVSELDERLEREMATIRSRGVDVQTSTRAVAALNHAIGEAPTPSPLPAEPPPRKPMANASAGNSGRNWLNRERRIGEADPGDPMKRPI